MACNEVKLPMDFALRKLLFSILSQIFIISCYPIYTRRLKVMALRCFGFSSALRRTKTSPLSRRLKLFSIGFVSCEKLPLIFAKFRLFSY